MSEQEQKGVTEDENSFFNHLFPIRVDKAVHAIHQKLAEDLAAIRRISLPLEAEPLFMPIGREDK